MTADVKLSHYLMRRVFNTQIIQKTISKHHPLCECNIIGHHHKYLSADIAFYNYYVTM